MKKAATTGWNNERTTNINEVSKQILRGNRLEYALKYNELGWCVIPVEVGSKKPLIKKWTPYQQRQSTSREIREWWEKECDANIGIVTGKISGLTVIDFDDPEAVKDFETMFGPLPQTFIQTTGRGCHYFYKYDPRINNKTGIIPKVDFKSEGGYIIVAPSRYSGVNIIEYSWTNFDPRFCVLQGLGEVDPIDWTA